jgi:hypothetical protein
MIENGYENVKTVSGGGAAMEKVFDYYLNGKLISPGSGSVKKPFGYRK